MITEYGIEAKSNSEIISELGGRFKQYRLFSNLTQKEVAVKAGVSIFTISQFEKGEAKNIGFITYLSYFSNASNALMAFWATTSASAMLQNNLPPEALRWPPPLKNCSETLLHGKSSTERRLTNIRLSRSVSSRKEMENLCPLIRSGSLTKPSRSPLMKWNRFIS